MRRSESTITSMYDFFTVYSSLMWFAILGSSLIFVAFGVLVHSAEWKLGMIKRVQVGDLIWKVFRLEVNQQYELEFRLSSGTLALGIFAFQCLIILSIYQSYIITSMVKFKDPRPFKPEDLLHQLQQRKYSFVSIG